MLDHRDEIAERAKRLLFKSSRLNYGVEDHFTAFVRIGDYALHWDDSYGLTINDHGDYHGTIFRVGARGGFERLRPEFLPQLLRTLRKNMVLDDLSDV